MVDQPFSSVPGRGIPRPGHEPVTAPGGPADHRRASEGQLLAALRARDLLALAEAWQRSAPAAHAVARRLMGPGEELERLLASVYGELWEAPPAGGPLERWARMRTFALGAAALERRGAAPAAPSVRLLLPQLPPSTRPAGDPVERVIAELPPDTAVALLRAHDAGVPAAEQEHPQAPALLEAALEALARHTVGAEEAAGAGPYAEPLGDLVLGLSPNAQDSTVQERMLAEPVLADRVRFLRRGRRRLEGLPPAPDLGPRVLLGVVARQQAAPAPRPPREPYDPAGTEDDVV
ncbi:MAG TPA: hypothetical protein VNU01_00170, partial [Egibacteraceae bacterium]|nr:hypothetical protein [Egibacteraceae bacterium]